MSNNKTSSATPKRASSRTPKTVKTTTPKKVARRIVRTPSVPIDPEVKLLRLCYSLEGKLTSRRRFKPADINYKIYNEDNRESLRSLKDDIKKRGQLEPLIVSSDDIIISGHRRWKAITQLHLPSVKYTVYDIESTDPGFTDLVVAFNNHRIKGVDEAFKEQTIKMAPKKAHQLLQEIREHSFLEESDLLADQEVEIKGQKKRSAISAAKQPFLDAVLRVFEENDAYLPLSDRQVHYMLLNDPPLKHASKPESVYNNDRNSYQALTDLLTRARLEYTIPFEWISDETRPLSRNDGYYSADEFIELQIHRFLGGYYRDIQQSQPSYIHIIAEKLTIRSIIAPVARKFCIPVTIARGYLSLDARYKIFNQFNCSNKTQLTLLFLTDHDPDGEEIIQSIVRSIRDDFEIWEEEMNLVKVALTREQAIELKLPSIMKAKTKSSNYQKFVDQYDTDVWELEAIKPGKLKELLREAILSAMDRDLYDKEVKQEEKDAQKLVEERERLREYYQFSDKSEIGQKKKKVSRVARPTTHRRKS